MNAYDKHTDVGIPIEVHLRVRPANDTCRVNAVETRCIASLQTQIRRVNTVEARFVTYALDIGVSH